MRVTAIVWLLSAFCGALPVHSAGHEGSVAARRTGFGVDERIDGLRAVLRVYHADQLGNTARFQDVVSDTVLQDRVRRHAEVEAALARAWGVRLSDDMLAKEIHRILRNTKDGARLRRIAGAVGDDPLAFAEIVVRPSLAERLARGLFRFDPTIHRGSRRTAETLVEAIRLGHLDPAAPYDGRTEHRLSTDGSSSPAPPWDLMSLSRIGETTPVRESRQAFVFDVLLERGAGGIRIARYTVPKRDWESWLESTGQPIAQDLGTVAGPRTISTFSLDFPALDCVADDTWAETELRGIPERSSHSLVWTGSEMIVWGGETHDPQADTAIEGGARYDPALDSWTVIASEGAPTPRAFHTAVWTGREMLVWGNGAPDFGGGRYDPLLDRWSPISKNGAPSPRFEHVAVWTGSEMLVWGGTAYFTSESLNSGGRYDPERDAWAAMSTLNAPQGRTQARAVWTGGEMLVWGGQAAEADDLPSGTGGRYDPATDQWTPIAASGAPSARWGHSAVWTGTEMIVWGGSSRSDLAITFNDGARYDPVADAWTPVGSSNAPSARAGHAAEWSGEYMIVWGGQIELEDLVGYRYRPADDSWHPMSTTSQPGLGSFQRSVWTGTEMIVWGGPDRTIPPRNEGGRYDPVLDQWRPVSTGPGPEPVVKHRAVWTGTEMLVWGGWAGKTLKNFPKEGGRFDPALDTWTPMSVVGAPDGRELHTAVWTGSKMIVWGGVSLVFDMENVHGDGAAYDPLTDSWSAVANAGAPVARRNHTSVWTGSEMIVWGGLDALNKTREDGARYNVVSNQWQPLSLTSAPVSRHLHTATWTGSVMVVWGGIGTTGGLLRTGGRYNPTTDAWSATNLTAAPTSRYFHSSVWTGSRVVIWGGVDATTFGLNTGGLYDPVSNAWSATSVTGAPPHRHSHSALWTGSDMLVWGGELLLQSSGVEYLSGGRFSPASNTWRPTSVKYAPAGRADHVAVWTGKAMLVWGGENPPFSTGGTYVVGPPDADADGVADACDCAVNDASSTAVPTEAASLRIASDKTALTWYASTGGSGTAHDVVRGTLATFPVGSGGESCLASGVTESRLDDPATPASGGYWYLVRGRNVCGPGTYGEATGGTRTTATCP